MAAEITDITECNRRAFSGYLPGPDGQPLAVPHTDTDMLVHILTDLHEALRLLTLQGVLLAKHDALLEEFRPLLDKFRSPLASKLPGGRRARS